MKEFDETIRPKAEHIYAIGRDLIKDHHSAIIELVKNAYDADASNVKIKFANTSMHNLQEYFPEEREDDTSVCEITIADNGEGMSYDDVIEKWLVPSNRYKLKKKKTGKQRHLQGNKGLGRFATCILGDYLILETIQNQEKTKAFINWNEFNSGKYLEEVKIKVSLEDTTETNGTILRIFSKEHCNHFWTKETISRLRTQLKRLRDPRDSEVEANDEFHIFLHTAALDKNDSLPQEDEEKDTYEEIESYPVLEIFNYRIVGEIDENNNFKWEYQNSENKSKSQQEEDNSADFGKQSKCGIVKFDIMVFDRESDSIIKLIDKLKSRTPVYDLGLQETKTLLNELSGIGVYRNGFRIRPLGDSGNDWLSLNQRRVQTPSKRISTNQVIGTIQIQGETESKLYETSARDGLKQNGAFDDLVKKTLKILAYLEEKRFEYRVKTKKSRTEAVLNKNNQISIYQLQNDFDKFLQETSIGKTEKQNLTKIMNASLKLNESISNGARDLIAFYDTTATLGMIVELLFHEVRTPLDSLSQNSNSINKTINKIIRKKAENVQQYLTSLEEANQGLGAAVKRISDFFSKIQPLAKQNEASKKYKIDELINAVQNIVNVNLVKEKVTFHKILNNDYTLKVKKTDFMSILLNLIDNSLHWCGQINKAKEITLEAKQEKSKLIFDYKDNGPGIPLDLIEGNLLFEPGVTRKIDGTGIGLTIAGNAAARNNLYLRALPSDEGAHFIFGEE